MKKREDLKTLVEGIVRNAPKEPMKNFKDSAYIQELMSIRDEAEIRLLQRGHNHSDDDWGELMDDEIYHIASERKTEII